MVCITTLLGSRDPLCRKTLVTRLLVSAKYLSLELGDVTQLQGQCLILQRGQQGGCNPLPLLARLDVKHVEIPVSR